MIPELETLYKKAMDTDGLTRWLQNKDIIKNYEESSIFEEKNRVQLLEALTGENSEAFRRYLDNRDDREDAESRMIFCQGLSIGLRLGSLCAWIS